MERTRTDETSPPTENPVAARPTWRAAIVVCPSEEFKQCSVAKRTTKAMCLETYPKNQAGYDQEKNTETRETTRWSWQQKT